MDKATGMAKKDFVSHYGPWALITGATEGVGRAFANLIASRGLNLVLTARNSEKLNELARELELRYNIVVRAVATDLSQNGAVDVLYVRCVDLDIGLVVSNAAATSLNAYLESGLSEVRSSLQLNVVTHADLARYFGELMLSKRDGRGGLLFMSSILGFQGTPYMSSFSAAKAFLLNFAEALHYENRKKGIHITAVAPGPVSSSMLTLVPRTEEVFRDYQLNIVDPDAVALGALTALEHNKARYIPDRQVRVHYGWWRQLFYPRSANVNHWGRLVQRYMKALLPRVN